METSLFSRDGDGFISRHFFFSFSHCGGSYGVNTGDFFSFPFLLFRGTKRVYHTQRGTPVFFSCSFFPLSLSSVSLIRIRFFFFFLLLSFFFLSFVIPIKLGQRWRSCGKKMGLLFTVSRRLGYEPISQCANGIIPVC